MTVARQVRVHGRVQGVFFRDECTQEARAHHVTGWVRNDDSGTVSAHFEGAEESVDAMLDWVRTGPPRARVDDVEVRDVPPEGHTKFAVQ